jgi:hypothetical protein
MSVLEAGEDNDSVFGTMFESLQLPEHSLFGIVRPSERLIFKTTFAALLMAQSLLAMKFFTDVAEQVTLQLLPAACDRSKAVHFRLVIVSSRLKCGDFSDPPDGF